MTTKMITENGIDTYVLMNEQDYLIASARTLGDPWNSEEQKIRFLTHATLGMSSELEELVKALYYFAEVRAKGDLTSKEFFGARVNVIEECGDFSWYNAIPKRVLNHVPHTDEDRGAYLEDLIMNGKSISEALAIEVGVIANETKRALFYNAPIREAVIVEAVNRIDVCLEDILEMDDVESNLFHARAININKLKKRFPVQFEGHQAINRNTDEELRIMKETPNGLVQ